MTVGSVIFSPHLPWSLVILLALAAVVVTALAGFNRARGWPLRGLVLAALLAGVLNPIAIREQRRPLSDIALIVADRTASQEIGRRPQQTAEAVAGITRQLSRRPGLETRLIEVTGAAAGDDGGTRLFTALDQALPGIGKDRVAAILMVTDGQVHDVPPGLAAGIDAPLHVLLTGRRDEADRRLVVVEAPRYGIVGKSLVTKVRIEEDGGPAETAMLTVKVAGKPVFAQTVRGGIDITIPFEVPHAGVSVVEITASPGPRELTLDNNRAVFPVNGVRDRLRVLLVSGEPHAGVRMWRNLLKADPAVDLVHFTILRTPRDTNTTPVEELALIAFPTRELFEEKLDDFDLIIFDRYRRRNVLPLRYLTNVAEYVESGGALLIAAGPDFAGPLSLYTTPLESVLPARPTRRVIERPFRPELTARGGRHPVTGDLERSGETGGEPGWGQWLRQIDAVALRGEVLMTGAEDKPLLVLDRVGDGRVAQLLSDQAWLWARGHDGGGPQAELLRRLAHWLMKEPDLEEEALRAEVRGRRILIEERSLSPRPRPVTLTAPDGTATTLALDDAGGGRFTGTITVDGPGIYRLADGLSETLAVVGALNALELAAVKATPERLKVISAASGGAVNWLEDGLPRIRFLSPGRRAHGSGWIALRVQDRYRVTGFSEFPLAPPWLLLILILGGLMWAWHREGR